MSIPQIILIFYLCAISLISAVIFTTDKINAAAGARRVPEKFLLSLSAIGGAAAIFVFMLLLRHKIRKKKFIVVVPFFILVHFAAVYFLWTKLF